MTEYSHLFPNFSLTVLKSARLVLRAGTLLSCKGPLRLRSPLPWSVRRRRER